jgi:predicted SprT family Zn-dependent metalloprotease
LTDGTREIFVIPTLDDSQRIADVITHELAHTLFGPDEKHGRNFKEAVTKLGLEGKATATIAGPGWHEWADPILEELGAIPHAAIDPSLSGVKKQKTYLIKCECVECGLIFRATGKAITGKALICPDGDCGGSVKVEGAEETGE